MVSKGFSSDINKTRPQETEKHLVVAGHCTWKPGKSKNKGFGEGLFVCQPFQPTPSLVLSRALTPRA